MPNPHKYVAIHFEYCSLLVNEPVLQFRADKKIHGTVWDQLTIGSSVNGLSC
jgi:hypothetical protein